MLGRAMGQKRKSVGEFPNPKRLQKQTALDETDLIYEEAHSDADYSSPDDASVTSESLHDTPATPFSTSSVRYPSELKTHHCPFEGCTKAFNRPARLQEHLRSHNNERLFKCTYDGCDKSFLRASHLNHHVKSAHTGIRDYVCDRPGCGKSFVTGSRLRRHLAAHDGRDKYRCTEYPPCNETFRKHSTLQKHVVSIHLKQKPFPCPHNDPLTGEKCLMAFETAGHLRAHESRIHTEKRFSCAECSHHEDQDSPSSLLSPVVFPTYSLLQAHIRAAHPPQCPTCSMTCSTPRELRRHLEVAHGNVSLEDRRIFPCTVPGCDRSFTKKGNLTVHIRTVHDGEKRFICGETDLSASKKVIGWAGDGCGKRYGSKLALEEHIRTAHLGFQNSKAERRQRLGLARKQQEASSSRTTGQSALAALTGEGYAEETGRQITCFVQSCPYRFHRKYDLWVHMGSKHSCTEDDIRDLFLRRALLGDDTEPIPGDILGIYGLEYDNGDPSCDPYFLGDSAAPTGTTADSNPLALLSDVTGEAYELGESSNLLNFPDTTDYNHDIMMQDPNSKIPNPDDTTMIDPFLDYNMVNP